MKLPKGVHVKPEKIENFFEICRKLDSGFTGALRLRGVKDHRGYTADLLVDLGVIVAASFKYVDLEPLLREDALDFIRNKLAGSSGNLDIFTFDSDEMRRSIESNPEALLEGEVKVHELGVKISSTIVKKPGVSLLEKISSFIKKPDDKRKEKRLEEIKTLREPVKLHDERREIDFGRSKDEKQSGEIEVKELPSKQAVGPIIPLQAIPTQASSQAEPQPTPQQQEIKPEKTASSDELARKEERLQKIKEARLKQIGERISIEKEEKVAKKIDDGVKVKTTIDHLYGLVLDGGSVKINDELAKKLKVSKTQLEEWAMILEEHNLVELHYPAIGEPELRKYHKEKSGD